jgi:hypothetical protein
MAHGLGKPTLDMSMLATPGRYGLLAPETPAMVARSHFLGRAHC